MTKLLMEPTKRLNFVNTNGDTIKNNFKNEIYYILKKFNESANYNNEAKMSYYKDIEMQITTYLNLFKDTKVLSEYIDTLVKMYNTIQKFKSEIYPDIYNYEFYCFENRYYHYYFK